MIRVTSPGLLSTVQDLGRTGYMRYGVSRSGAMDAFSFRLGNILVGNGENTPAIEATLLLPGLYFTRATLFAVTGARVKLTLKTAHGTYEVPEDTAVVARGGDELMPASMSAGVRAYIAFAGGMALTKPLGSAAADKKAGIGGTGGGGKLLRDMCIMNASPDAAFALEGARATDGILASEYVKKTSPVTLRALEGPQYDMLDARGKETLFSAVYKVSNDSDRMGVRFEGERVSFIEGEDGNIITDALTSGAVQIAKSGQPILMCADAQTAGGYSKPAWVISADMPLAAQLRPGDEARFLRTSLDEAYRALREQRRLLDEAYPKGNCKLQ